MNREELKKILPHREPMLLLDEAYIDENGNSCSSYHVTGDEFFLQGHYPGNPIVPGVIQCEMAAQTCALLFMERLQGKTPLYTGINKVKFYKQVKPGDTIRFICSVKREKDPFYFTEGTGFVNCEECISGEFSFALI